MADKDQRTEQPTARRLQKAREEGNFVSARLFVSALQFTAFVAALGSWGGACVIALREDLRELLRHAVESQLESAYLVKLAVDLISRTFLPLGMIGAVLMGVTLASQLLVTKLGFSLKKLSPDIGRLNPIGKLKQLPS